MEADRLAVKQSGSLLIYSSVRKLRAWQTRDQISKSEYTGTGHSLPPFLAMVSWEGKKQKEKPVFLN